MLDLLDENLCGINCQLENEDLIQISKILTTTQSTHIYRFNAVIKQIEVSFCLCKNINIS